MSAGTATLTNYPITPGPVPAGTAGLRVALVGCGRDKTAHAARARDLYTGHLFRSAHRYVEAAQAAGVLDAWFVLSARYGLVHPDRVVGPYEATMDGKTRDQLDAWVRRVDGQLRGDWGYGAWSQDGGAVHVVFLAGAAYVDPLMAWWWGRSTPLGWTHEAPLAGLGMGERRGWFAARHRELATPVRGAA
jgi:hypothetical protein